MRERTVSDRYDVDSVGVQGSSVVVLHRLNVRQDGHEWVVGRLAIGNFVVLPPIGVRTLDLLSTGMRVREVELQLKTETGRDVDVADFVRRILDLGFLAELNGCGIPGPPRLRESLPWLRPRHVRLLLSPVVPVLVSLVVVAAVVVLVLNPTLVPDYRDLLWSEQESVVLLSQTLLGWVLICLHELAHLVTARAAGVPGNIRLGTRLQFLAAVTDVSGIWAAPRRHRITVYAAGMCMNLAISSTAILLLTVVPRESSLGQALAVLVLLPLLFIPFQFLVFMRTDVYFIIQDVSGCRNLYRDGCAYAGYLLRRIGQRLHVGSTRGADPSLSLPLRERRVVRSYSLFLVIGTGVCLSVAGLVTIPFVLNILGSALTNVVRSDSPAAMVDSIAVFVIFGGAQVLWCRTWWRSHGDRCRRWIKSPLSRGSDSSKPG